MTTCVWSMSAEGILLSYSVNEFHVAQAQKTWFGESQPRRNSSQQLDAASEGVFQQLPPGLLWGRKKILKKTTYTTTAAERPLQMYCFHTRFTSWKNAVML